MQRVANSFAADGPMPPGCIALSKIEHAVRRLVEKELSRIPNTPGRAFTGGVPKSFWAEEMDFPRPLRDWFIIARDKITSGIVSLLMERLIWPLAAGVAQHSGPEHSRLFILCGGKLNPFRVADALYLCDPAQAPEHCNTMLEVLCFHEFSDNRRNNHPFIDRANWTISERPRFDLAGSNAETREMNAIWDRISVFAGAPIVYREASGRQNRDWKAPSEVARMIEADLRRISNNTPARKGTPQFDEMITTLRRTLAVMSPEKKRQFGYRELAQELGLDPEQRHNSAVRAIMQALRADA